MATTFKGPRCEVEFQVNHDGEGGYACYECLLGGIEFGTTAYLADTLAAIKHLQEHVAKGHMVPQSLIVELQRDMEYECLVHQSGMSPLRRHDGSHSGDRERAFHDQWSKEQSAGFGSGPLFRQMLSNLDLLPMTQRDATIAATLVQWLGTNVGFCFLEQALRRCGYEIVKVESCGGPNQ